MWSLVVEHVAALWAYPMLEQL
jgi:hypothetical protein